MKTLAAQPTVAFASKIHSQLAQSTESAFYSPFSLQVALGICTQGAKGLTRVQLENLLGENVDYKELIGQIQENEHYELSSANALWAHGPDDGFLTENFVHTVQEDFQANITNVDFVNAPEAAVEQINDWCSKETREKIPSIITIDLLNKQTKLVITNAIYFKGKWKTAFKKEATLDLEFRGTNGTKNVPTMNVSGGFTYSENDDFQALELDYQGDDLSMVVLLPTGETTDYIDNNLEQCYHEAVNNFHFERSVQVSLPKFEFETKYALSSVLREAGATAAFSDNADFSGISEEIKLKISEVIHKAFVSVDEEGTVAAAATAVLMMRCTSAMINRPKVFNVDHPFVFFIRNKKTNDVLFCGRVCNL